MPLADFFSAFWNNLGLETALAAAMLANMILGALIQYCIDPDHRGPRGVLDFARYCLPRRVLLHRSALMDYAYAVTHKLLYAVLIAPAIAAALALGHATVAVAERLFGPPVHHGASWGASFAYTMIALVLLRDFWIFVFHRLEHKVWWLWQFHKTHHSAEAMAWGLTARRNHPVDEVLQTFAGTLLPALAFGLFAYLVNADVDEVLVWGVSIFFIVECLGFRHLKHSHIHMRFPRWLEYILVSPAQHQLHHSREGRHWDRNFSTLFAFWDVIFGSWHRSEPVRNFRIGLPGEEASEFNRSILHLYFLGFAKVWREAQRRRRASLSPSPEPLLLALARRPASDGT